MALDVGLAHALEIVPALVELADVVEAEPLELAQLLAAQGGPVGRLLLAARPRAAAPRRRAVDPLQTQRFAPLVLPVSFLVHGFRWNYGGWPQPPASAARQAIRPWITGGGRIVALRDDIGIAQPFCCCRQRRLVAGMHQRQGLLRADLVADPAHLRQPDGVVHGMARMPPAAAQLDHGQAQRPGVHRVHPARRGRRHRPHQRCPRQMGRGPLQEVHRPAQRRAPCARTARPRHPRRVPPPPQHGRHRRRRRGRPGPAPRRTAPAPPPRSRGCAASPLQHGDALGDLDRVAGGVPEALAHVGQQGHRRQAGAMGDADDAARQCRGLLAGRHEGARAGLDVHHQGLQARRPASWTGSRR